MDILFVTATRIGDAVLSTGLLSHLVERHPGARLTIAAGPVAAPLFEAVPGLERVIAVTKRRWRCIGCRFCARVAGRRWDLVVDLRGSALAWMLRAGERRVMAKGDAARASRAPAWAACSISTRRRPRVCGPRRTTSAPPRRCCRPAAAGAGDRPGRQLARQAMARRALRRAGAAADRGGRAVAGRPHRGVGGGARAGAGGTAAGRNAAGPARSTWSAAPIC